MSMMYCEYCDILVDTDKDEHFLVDDECENLIREQMLEEICNQCDGSGEGYVDGSNCPHCKGSGSRYTKDDVDDYLERL